ncbi:CHAT domain-containing protein [Nonomuraea angiospora]
MRAESDLAAIRAARKALDEVIDDIRAVPGYEGFLASPAFDDVVRAARRCPLVYLAAAEQGGVALIVRDDQVTHVSLERLTAPSLRERVTEHLAIYASQDRAAWDSSLEEITGWLWPAVMGPVLEALGTAGEAVLVAGGLLGLLPLHAAWTPDPVTPTGRRHALDAMPLSYTPNARSLRSARALAAQVAPQRLLAVAEPLPVSAPRLRRAAAEAEIAAAAFPGSPVVLSGERATTLAFASGAPRADVLHLGCHGFADLAGPLDSGLLMAGNRRVTLRDLFGLRLRVRLAVLSACETAMPGTELPDEVVSLPTGLLQAGVAGVVASQWAVPELATAMLVALFYRGWRQERMTPAAALRQAQRWLRDSTNDEKVRFLEDPANASWLPPAVAEDLLEGVAYLEPEDRDHAAVRVWGAFAHIGA